MTETAAQDYMTSAEIQQAFEDLLARGASEQSLTTVFGDAALALALSGAAPDPDRIIYPSGRGQPALSATLAGLEKIRKDKPAGPRLRVSRDASVPLPPGVEDMPSYERLAIWLLRAGANPWLTERTGLDAFDWAMAANSRTVVDLILAHPQCPDQATLEARTSSLTGRSVPWLHTLAYFGQVNLFDDMVGRGWDPLAKDRNGWVPAAWVNQVNVLQRVIEQHPNPVDDQLSIELNAAWSRRNLQKLHELNFKPDALASALAATTILTPEQEENLKLLKVVEQWIAATPTKKSYNVAGVKWRGSSNGNPDTVALLTKHFDWRYEPKSRTARGSWSPLGAALWAVTRGEEQIGDAVKVLAPLAAQVLSAQPEASRLKWLNEEISPGLSNRGLALWAMGANLSTDIRQVFSEGLDETTAQRARMEAATSAALAMVNKSSADQWTRIVSSRWFAQAVAEGMFGYQLAPWVWTPVASMAKEGLFTPSQEAFKRLADRAVTILSQQTEELSLCLPAVTELMRVTSYKVAGQYSYTQENIKAVNGIRLSLWKALETLLEKQPELSQSVDIASYPFSDQKADIASGKSEFPSQEAWDSFIRRARLLGISTTSQEEKSPSDRRAPRM